MLAPGLSLTQAILILEYPDDLLLREQSAYQLRQNVSCGPYFGKLGLGFQYAEIGIGTSAESGVSECQAGHRPN